MTKERFKIANELWSKGIKAEVLYNENPRMDKQMDYACDNRIPFIIFIGENEVKENRIKVKCMANSSEVISNRENFVEEILKLRQDEKLLIIENKSAKK
jgi:histidyl-tRNA synthetase